MSIRVQVVFDATDPHALARFWAAAVGHQQEDHRGIVAQLLDGGQLTEAEVVEVV